MNSPDINLNSIIAPLRRFHLVIFIVLLTVGLSIMVIMLNGIINKASDTSSHSPSENSSNFDQETIDRISKLKTSAEPSTPLNLSSGRIDPFNE